jgi:DNA excision repair protein ERCC-3
LTADSTGPLLLPSADTLLLQVAHDESAACRAELAAFAELEKSPDHLHTYRLTDLGLWNARAAGIEPETVIDALTRYSYAPIPHAMARSIADAMDRFGRITIEGQPDQAATDELLVRVDEPELLDRLTADNAIGRMLGPRLDPYTASLAPASRGRLKQLLVAARLPADDQAILSPGLPFELTLSDDLELRRYQRHAVEGWLPSGTGVVVLPCGAGKTVTGIAAAAAVGARTLVLVTGEASMRQWHDELCRFTTIDPDDIGCYAARTKTIGPVTLATYHVMTARKDGRFRHLDLLQSGDWGLVIYDEVHLLPSAVFQMTAGIQSRRRLGLTATLVREDGREGDVFSLVGPKRFDVPWRELELQGWLAPAVCTEVRIVPTDTERLAHASALAQQRARVAAAIEGKTPVVEALLARHEGEAALVIGTYLDGLHELADRLGVPIVTGATPAAERQRLFDAIRAGELSTLVVSKVANFSLDLPEVSVAVQVSGTFGSRQEEAQRLGRILRPKADGRQAHFYSIVAQDTVEQTYAQRRQRFLAEQGYGYNIVDGAEVLGC